MLYQRLCIELKLSQVGCLMFKSRFKKRSRHTRLIEAVLPNITNVVTFPFNCGVPFRTEPALTCLYCCKSVLLYKSFFSFTAFAIFLWPPCFDQHQCYTFPLPLSTQSCGSSSPWLPYWIHPCCVMIFSWCALVQKNTRRDEYKSWAKFPYAA